MKRYYTSFLRYKLVMILLPIVFIFNGVVFMIDKTESNGALGIPGQFMGYFFIIMAIFMTINLIRILKNDVYFEINQDKMINRISRKEITYEYSDAEFYTFQKSGNGGNIFYRSLESGKKVKIGLSSFEIDYTEFMTLLKKYSKKDIYYKDYGQEAKIFEVKDIEFKQ